MFEFCFGVYLGLYSFYSLVSMTVNEAVSTNIPRYEAGPGRSIA